MPAAANSAVVIGVRTSFTPAQDAQHALSGSVYELCLEQSIGMWSEASDHQQAMLFTKCIMFNRSCGRQFTWSAQGGAAFDT